MCGAGGPQPRARGHRRGLAFLGVPDTLLGRGGGCAWPPRAVTATHWGCCGAGHGWRGGRLGSGENFTIKPVKSVQSPFSLLAWGSAPPAAPERPGGSTAALPDPLGCRQPEGLSSPQPTALVTPFIAIGVTPLKKSGVLETPDRRVGARGRGGARTCGAAGWRWGGLRPTARSGRGRGTPDRGGGERGRLGCGAASLWRSPEGAGCRARSCVGIRPCPARCLAAGLKPASASRCTHPRLPVRPGSARLRPHPAGEVRGEGWRGLRPAPPRAGRVLTHFISRSVKMRLSRHMRSGTVRMRMKGKAREATVDMTAQSTAKHASCSPVKRCMRSVRTCMGAGVRARGTLRPPSPRPAPLPAAWLPQPALRP